MTKGTTAMSAIAVLVTGGYFAYDYWETRKAKQKERAPSAKWMEGSGGGSAASTARDPARDAELAERNAYRAGHPPGSGGGEGGSDGSGSGSNSGSGSETETETETTHKVQRLQVPNVVGLTPEKATAQLVAMGFKPDVLEYPPNLGCHYDDEQRDIVPVGSICNQERDPGAVLMSNAKLRVVIEKDTWEHGGVESDNEWHRMPALEGMSLDKARALLRAKGFGDDEFNVGEAHTSCGKGLVCEQRPKPDARKYVREVGELNVGN